VRRKKDSSKTQAEGESEQQRSKAEEQQRAADELFQRQTKLFQKNATAPEEQRRGEPSEKQEGEEDPSRHSLQGDDQRGAWDQGPEYLIPGASVDAPERTPQAESDTGNGQPPHNTGAPDTAPSNRTGDCRRQRRTGERSRRERRTKERTESEGSVYVQARETAITMT
jgi:hypothetical protein